MIRFERYACLREWRPIRSRLVPMLPAKRTIRKSVVYRDIGKEPSHPQPARSTLVHGSAAVDDKRHGFGRDAGSDKASKNRGSAWAVIRRIELPAEHLVFRDDDIPSDKSEMFADIDRRRGKQGGGGNAACLASRHIGLAMLLAVRRLFGNAEDGQGTIRQAVLGKLDGARFRGAGSSRTMGEADGQQCDGAKNAHQPLRCPKASLPHGSPHHFPKHLRHSPPQLNAAIWYGCCSARLHAARRSATDWLESLSRLTGGALRRASSCSRFAFW